MTSVVGIFILMILIMVLELADSVESSQSTGMVKVGHELKNTVDSLRLEVTRMQEEYDFLQKSQLESASINIFNSEKKVKELEGQLQRLEDLLDKTHANIGAVSKAIIVAERIHLDVLAEAEACEADRHEIERMLRQKEEVERVATILDTDHPVVYRDKTIEGRYLVIIRLERDSIFVTDSGANVSRAFKGMERLRQLKTWLDTTQLGNRQILLVVKPSGVSDFDEVATSLEDSGVAYGFDVSAEDAIFMLRSQLEVGG